MRTLTIASNVTLFGILWIFWRIVRDNKLKAIYFIPIPFILLQPQYYLTSLWTITGFNINQSYFGDLWECICFQDKLLCSSLPSF
jgi:hypothetical protein